MRRLLPSRVLVVDSEGNLRRQFETSREVRWQRSRRPRRRDSSNPVPTVELGLVELRRVEEVEELERSWRFVDSCKGMVLKIEKSTFFVRGLEEYCGRRFGAVAGSWVSIPFRALRWRISQY